MRKFKRRVIIFFICLVAMTWFVNHVLAKETDSDPAFTMANNDIEDTIEEMINDRYGSLPQALTLSKRNYSIKRWLKLYD